MPFVFDPLGTVGQFRELFGVPSFVVDSRLEMSLEMATLELKSWVNDSIYADATIDPPENQENHDILVIAEYFIASAKLLYITGINTRVDLGRDLVESIKNFVEDLDATTEGKLSTINFDSTLQFVGNANLSPEGIKGLAEIFLMEAKHFLVINGINLNDTVTPLPPSAPPIDQDMTATLQT